MKKYLNYLWVATKYLTVLFLLFYFLIFPIESSLRGLVGERWWETFEYGFAISGVLYLIPIALILFGPLWIERIMEQTWHGTNTSVFRKQRTPHCPQCALNGKTPGVRATSLLREDWEHDGEYHRFPVVQRHMTCTNGHMWIIKG